MLTLIFAGTIAMAILPPQWGFAEAGPLASFQWQNRVLLIFGSSEKEVAEQEERFHNQESQVDERDLVILTIVNNVVSDGGRSGSLPTASALRTKFRVDQDASLTVVLVGKDGGEKLRETELTEPKAVFDLIDSMPMRKDEARDS